MQINPVHVNSGDEFRLAFADVQQTPKNIPVDYPHLNEITTQTRMLLDDGLVESQVVQNRGDELIVQMMNDGPIGTGKKVTIQGHRVKLPFLTEWDKQDMLFAIENNIHIIAASFVRSGDDVRSLRAFFADHGAKVIIFSKIDHREAVDNLIALFGSVRWHHGGAGDLGVEIPLEEVPGIQEKIIKQCNQAGTPVIVATQIIITSGSNLMTKRGTNLLEIYTVRDIIRDKVNMAQAI